MAERVGFEPTVTVRPQRFSRPPLSTTQAPLLKLCRFPESLSSSKKCLSNPLHSRPRIPPITSHRWFKRDPEPGFSTSRRPHSWGRKPRRPIVGMRARTTAPAHIAQGSRVTYMVVSDNRPRVQGSHGLPDGLHLGVRGRILLTLRSVSPASNHETIPYDQCPNGDSPPRQASSARTIAWRHPVGIGGRHACGWRGTILPFELSRGRFPGGIVKRINITAATHNIKAFPRLTRA